jgi:AcrR family transcriptional regulator
MSPRPKMDHVRRPQLLSAAAELLYEKGFADTQVSDVAERVGMSAANVLHYFHSKDALLEQALDFDEEEFFYEPLTAELQALERPTDKLVHLLRRIADPPRRLNDWTLLIETWARALRSAVVRDAAERDARRFADILSSVVREGQLAGEFRDDVDPEAFAVLVNGLVDGLGVGSRLEYLGLTPQRVSALVIEFALGALGRESVSAPAPAASRSPEP